MGVGLLGSFLVFLHPLVYYITTMLGLVLSLYGFFMSIFQGILTGPELKALQLVWACILFFLVGLLLYLGPFLFRWPIYVELGYGYRYYFGPSLTLLYSGLLQIGLIIVGLLLLIPDVFRQWRMRPDELYKPAGQVRSYQTIVAAYEPPDIIPEKNHE